MQSFVISNVGNQNSEINVINRLSKKYFNNDNLIFLSHYKRIKSNSLSPIIPCESCPLSVPESLCAHFKTNKPCIIQTDFLYLFKIPIRSLNKIQYQQYSNHNIPIYKANFFPESYRNFIY